MHIAVKDKKLVHRMIRLGIYDKDLNESFTRSSGPGGQNVNKVSTCVHLSHQPSGITIKCQKERSQLLNRLLARKLLCVELEKRLAQKRQEVKDQIARMRRQNRKRSFFEKERVLEQKHERSQKKQFRRKLSLNRIED